MGLKFLNNYDITEALDETCLGAVRFGALEESDRVFDNEMKEYTGEIKRQHANLIFGNPGQPKIARRVKFPPDADLTGFKRRDPVRLIDPEYHLMYIPAQDGNREYADLVIYAKGLEKAEAPTNNPNLKQSQEKDLDQKQPSVDSKEKEKK
ncbi:hypothetical protein P7E30_19210 [Enterococcus gallinarum]|uniref:Uncharacterized protein n=1 Tax=Enterococcus gallinarum TaxID=1353 RepID=A0AAE4KZC1_ENTGA|nr:MULTISPECIES: hypothetical protein [Enterococcus]MDT2316434.1 hypothetical protein [Enterococcus faecium]MDT2381636.1 hypothetical protein [Enterococcus avium]MDT2686400.1 hypothetical protein [Enterococcus gallinarum]MDT2692286.1 hypothetical protein [Enterococcus gallinarum]WGS34201.1 hypothetical protein N8I78_07185 [Enterococcus faecalis]